MVWLWITLSQNIGFCMIARSLLIAYDRNSQEIAKVCIHHVQTRTEFGLRSAICCDRLRSLAIIWKWSLIFWKSVELDLASMSLPFSFEKSVRFNAFSVQSSTLKQYKGRKSLTVHWWNPRFWKASRSGHFWSFIERWMVKRLSNCCGRKYRADPIEGGVGPAVVTQATRRWKYWLTLMLRPYAFGAARCLISCVQTDFVSFAICCKRKAKAIELDWQPPPLSSKKFRRR